MQWFLEICHFAGLQLQLEFIGNQGDEFRIGRFAFRIADSIAKKSLQSIQITSVPCDLDGVADGTFHTAGGGLECFCHLGVEHLGDGISLASGQQEGVAGATQKGKICEWLIALFVAQVIADLLGL